MHLNPATFVTEECLREKMLGRSASNARQFFSILPDETLASKSHKFKCGNTLLLPERQNH